LIENFYQESTFFVVKRIPEEIENNKYHCCQAKQSERDIFPERVGLLFHLSSKYSDFQLKINNSKLRFE
jgi:hypothetical protein